MSSDNSPAIHRFSRLLGGLAIVALLAGCQARPLYSEASGNAVKLAEIEFSDADTRVEQVVRNHLVYLTSGGAGETRTPAYRVELHILSTYSDVLDDHKAVAQPGRIRVGGTYWISRISDGKVLKTGQRTVTALTDISDQRFAELRSIRDAENRAARELAEFIRADIAIVLEKEPQPQPTWQK